MQSYIKLHKISFSSLVKIFSIKTTSLINNYLYLYIIIDNLIIMQVRKKINIKNWNNEECQGGGALEKKNNLVMEKGKIILNGNEIPLVWNYELTKKTVPINEDPNKLTDETVLKLEIVIDGIVVIKNS